jgi:hypothetical protein
LKFLPIKYFLLLLLLLSLPAYSQITRLNLEKKYPVLLNEDMIWIGTPNGLYQYDYDDNVFKKYSLPQKQNNENIKQIFKYQDYLWCVLEKGLAALHLKLNEWLVFDSTNGLPSNDITAIDFLGDYVWVSTKNGAARFDLLIEQWEKYDNSKGLTQANIKDLVSANEKIWFLTENEFLEYETKFEKWRNYKFEGEILNYKRIIKYSDELWFLSNNGITRFNPVTQYREFYSLPCLNEESLLEIFTEGNILWIISRQGIFYFDKNSNIWKEFEGNSYLKEKKINNGYISGDQIWIFTGDAILLWSRTNKTWETIDYSSGLSSTNYSGSYTDGTLTMLINEKSIEYRKTSSDPWHIFSFTSQTRTEQENLFNNFLDNPEGGYIPVGNYKWNWQGTNIIYLYDFENNLYDNFSKQSTGSNYRMDIKNHIDFGNSRKISGFYNNIDLNATEYGLKYRGNDSDFVREIGLGDFRRDPGDIAFNEGVNLYGGNFRLQYGDKTERFKRSLLSIKGNAGEIRTKKTYEIYSGAFDNFNYTINSNNFTRNRFYKIKGLPANSRPDDIKIYVDDLNYQNNTGNTLSHKTFAGISGDFDELKPVEDFYFNEKINALCFIKTMNSSSVIIITYKLNNQYYESVLQSGNYSTAQNNIYYLSGQKIIPYTLKIKILDTNGNAVPLNRLGLDNDNDGSVDLPYLDYEKGILSLPEKISLPWGSRMQVQYKTERSMIQLKHKNLLRGSEVLYLDGATAGGGNDYIIDYTNGTLIFVREGVMNDDTRIEIEYEYYDESDDIFTGVGINYSPSDNFFIQAGWQKTDKSDINLLDLNSEIRYNLKGYDIRILPGIIYSPAFRQLTGKSVDGYISSNYLRLRTLYQDYSENYVNLYKPQFSLGDLKNKAQVTAEIDLPVDIRFKGEWKKSTGFLINNINPTDELKNISLLLHNSVLPNIRISLQDIKSVNSDSSYNKTFIQGITDYQIPKDLVKKILLENIKLEGFIRFGKEEEDIRDIKRNFNQWHFRFNTQISSQFQGGIFYRRNEYNDDLRNDPITSSEKVLFDLSHEEWQLIQTNLRVENNLDKYYLTDNGYTNSNLSQFSQINFRISPGKIWEKFNPLFFELNYNNTLYDNGLNPETFNKYLWQLSSVNVTGLSEMYINRNYYIKNEYRPYSDFLLYSLFEWNTQENRMNINRMSRFNFRWNEKIDMKISMETRLIVQFKYYYLDQAFNRFTNEYEPSVWIEHRFSTDLQNSINLIYKKSIPQDNNITITGNNWQARYNLIWRTGSFPGMKYTEINQSFGGNYQKTSNTEGLETILFSSNSSIDLYPLYSLVIRLRFDISRYMDLLYDRNCYTYLAFNLKATLKL